MIKLLFLTIQVCISSFVCTKLECQTFLFDPLIGPLSGATTLGYKRPGSDGNERVFRIPESCSITEGSPSDFLMSYPEDS